MVNTYHSNNNSKLNRFVGIILILAMLFAAWHVATHEIDFSGDTTSHEECQVCRIGNVPIVDLAKLILFTPLLLLSSIVIIPAVIRTNQSPRYILGARAPPLN